MKASKSTTYIKSEPEALINCIKLNKPSLLQTHFAYIDNQKHFADDIFARRQANVKVTSEFEKPGTPYVIVICKVPNRKVRAFLGAMQELPRRMLVCGYPDYTKFCNDFWEELKQLLANT